MQIPAEITTLIERFARNIDSYKAPGYKEAQLRPFLFLSESLHLIFQCQL